MNKESELPEQIEEIRQKAAENPDKYPVDYAVRLVSAIVAEYADITAAVTGQMN